MKKLSIGTRITRCLSRSALLLGLISTTALADPPNPIVTTSVLVTSSSPIVFEVNFGEAVTGFALDDIVVVNGTASAPVDAGAGVSYTFDVTPTADGDVTVTIPADSVENGFSELNTASLPATTVYDTTGATPVLTSTAGAEVNASPTVVQVDFGENTSGFLSTDLVVTGGLVGNLTNVDGSIYIVEITPSTPSLESSITVDLPAAVSTDIAGNANLAGNSLTYNYDPIPPTPQFSTAATNPTAVSPITFSIDFGETVTGLTEADFTVTNGVASNLATTDSQTYTVDVAPTVDGEVVVALPIAAAQDAANLDSPAGEIRHIYAATAPVPAITSSDAPSTSNASFSVSVDFGQVVTGFDATDIVVTNGAVSNLLPAGDAQSFTFDFAPTAEGAITIDIFAAAAATLASVDNAAAPTFNMNYDVSLPVPVISSTEASPTTAASWPVTFDFGEEVTGFAIADVTVSGDVNPTGSLSALSTTDGIVYTATFTPNANTTHTLSIAGTTVADTAGNANTVSNTLSIENNSPVTLSGIVRDKAGVTAKGAGLTVSVLINGTKHGTSVQTDASGRYTFTDLDYNADDTLSFFLDGNTEAGVRVDRRSADASSNVLDIHEDNLLLNGIFSGHDFLAGVSGADPEVGRIYTMQPTANPNVAATEFDLHPGDNVTFRLTSGGSLTSKADFNPNRAANFTMRIDGILSLANSRTRAWVSGDLLSIIPGDDRDANGKTFGGQILTNRAANNGSIFYLGFAESNVNQRVSGGVNLDLFEFGGAATPHTLCFDAGETYQFERFVFNGNPAPNQHLLRTCDAATGVELDDGSQHSITATNGDYIVSNISYTNSNNISGIAVDPTGDSVDEGNSNAWQSAQISGVIFDDDNNNGVQDGTESGIPGVTVKFYADNGNNVFDFGDAEVVPARQTTDANGNYSAFVAATTYFVSPSLGNVEAELSDQHLYTQGSEGLNVLAILGTPVTDANFGFGDCSLLVNTTSDTFGADGATSFSEALYCADSGQRIDFDPSLNNQIVLLNTRNPLRQQSLIIENRDLDINTVNTQNITVRSADLGSWVFSNEPAVVLTDTDSHIKGLDIVGGRSTGNSHTTISGTNTIVFEDVNLRGSISRYGGAVRILGSGSVQFIRSSISTNNVRSNAMNIAGSVDFEFIDSRYTGNRTHNNGGGNNSGMNYTGSGDFIVRGSSIDTNDDRAGFGEGAGVMYSGSNAAAVFEITNSTISGNIALNEAGGVRFSPTANVQGRIAHTTIFGNRSVADSPGLLVTNGSLTLSHTVVAGNTQAGVGIVTATQVNDAGNRVIYEHSYVGDEYRHGALVEVRGDALVGPFTDANADAATTTVGHTHDLVCESPLIDAGGATSLANPPATTDQLNRPRSLGEAIDIGAVEFRGATNVSSFAGATAGELYALGEEVLIDVTFCASVTYTPNSGDLTLGLSINGVSKTAIYDATRSALTPANRLTFRYVAEPGLLDLDGIDVVANSLALSADATLRGPADTVDVTLAHAATQLPNDQVDTFPPIITFTDDIAQGPVLSDIMIVAFSDQQPNPSSYAYGFSADAVCDATDTYPNALDSGSPVQFNTQDNNAQYICVTAEDAAGNLGYAVSAFPLNIDNTGPDLVLSTSEPPRTGANPIPFTMTFSEDVTGFDVGDLQVVNAVAQNFTMVSASVYTVELVPPPGGGLVRVTVPANSANDTSGIGNEQRSLFVISDVSAPTPVITINSSNPTSASPIPVSVDFGEPVNGFNLSDLVMGNGTAGDLVSIGSRVFNFNVTPSADGLITIDIPALAARDLVNLDSLVALQASVTYDSTPPTPVVSATGPSPTNSQMTFTLQFDEDVTGLAANELVVVNGTVAALTEVDARNYTLTVDGVADGEVQVTVPAGVAQDTGGNSNQASNTASVLYDITGPFPVVTSVLSSPTNNGSVPLTISFAEPVTGFDETDLVIGNATYAPGSFSGSGTSYSLLVNATADGPVTIDIDAAAGADPLGNPTQVAEQFAITVDTVGPTPVLATSVGASTSANPIPVTVTFPEDVTGLALSDFVVTGGTIQNLQGGPAAYTLDIVPTANGPITLDLPATTANDMAGNASLVSNTLSVTYDSSVPTPVITTTAPNPTRVAPIPIAIDFQEPVTGFDATDLVLVNATLDAGSLVDTGDGQNYTATITPIADGEITVSIPADAAQDASLNLNSASSDLKIVYDTTQPTVVIASTETDPTGTSPIPLTVTFSEEMTGVELTDFVVGNGTLADLVTTDNIVWTMNLTPTADGAVTVDMAAAQAQDQAGNDNVVAPQYTINYDSTGPTPVIASTLTGPTNTSPIPVTVDFSEAVTDFNLADLVVGNGGVSDFTDNGNGQFSFNVTPNNAGQVTVDIEAGAAKDATDNDSNVAVQFSIDYDNTPPTPIITSTVTDTTNVNPIPITIDFGEDVTGFDASEIVVTNASLQNFVAVDAKTYTAELVPITDGVITVDVAADVATDTVGLNNLVASQFTVTYDSRVPVPVLSSAAAPSTGSSPFAITISFAPIEVAGFDVTDLVVNNGTASNVQTTDNITFTADITPTAEGVVEISVPGAAATSVATGVQATASTQLDVIYDLSPPTPVISSLEPSPTGVSPILVSVDFGETVTGFDLTDLDIGNGTAANLVNINDARYTVEITPTAGGEVTVDIPAAAAQDAVSLPSLVATQFSITYNNGALAVSDVTVDENAGTVSVDVTLTGVLTAGTDVTYTTTDGTATAGSDYVADTGTLTFAGTDGEVQSITLTISPDNIVEVLETFDVTISAPTNALATISDDKSEVSITDASKLTIEFTQATAADAEDTGGNLPTLTLSGAQISAPESIEVVITGGTAEVGRDYTLNNPLTVVILPADYSTATPLALSDFVIITDAAFESDETIELALQSPSANLNIADADGDTTVNSTHIYTITNDDLSIGPGGVALDAEIWLKADAGVTEAGNLVSAWDDQSGLNNHVAVPAGVGTPELVNDSLNFNPVLRFDQQDYLSNSDSLLGDGGEYTKIVVYKRDNNTGNMALIGSDGDIFANDPIHGMFYQGGTDNLKAFHGMNFTATPADIILESTSTDSVDDYYIGVIRYGAGGTQTNVIRVNGVETDSNTTVKSYTDLGVQIGADQMSPLFLGGGGNFFGGDMGEAVLYGAAASDTDLAKLESYLAVKWGITLTQTAPRDYVASSGAIVWNAVTAGTYNQDIAGIGRDDNSELGQVKSRSVNTDALFTIEAVGEGSNATPAFADLEDAEFLMWANNNGAANWTVTGAPAGFTVLERQWQAQEIAGDTGDTTFTINVDNAALDIPAFVGPLYLITGTDLSAATPVAMTDLGGGVWQAAGVNLADGDLFTVAVANAVIVEFDLAATASTDETAANNLPSLLISGTLSVASSVDVIVADGTATAGTDYTMTTPITIPLPAGSYDGTTPIALPAMTLTNDAIVEAGGETVDFSLANFGSGVSAGDVDTADGVESTSVYTITDDDTVLVELTANASAPEAAAVLPQLLVDGTVTAPTTVTIAFSGGDAAVTSDYTATTPLVVTIPAGVYDGSAATAVALDDLAIVNDDIVEADETLELTATAATGDATIGDANGDTTTASVSTYTITNDDQVLVEFGVDTQADEATGGSQPVVLVQGTVTAGATVVVSDAGTGTATLASDYTMSSPVTLTVPPGVYDGTAATAIALTGLNVVDDAIAELDETVNLSLSVPTGEMMVGDVNSDTTLKTNAVYTIVNDDKLSVALAAANVDVTETTGAVAFDIVVSGGEIGVNEQVDVEVTIAGTTATATDDFTFGSPKTVIIPAGDYATATRIAVPDLVVVDDQVDENSEVIALSLSGFSAGVAGGVLDNSTVTIADDDTAGVTITPVSNLTSEDGDTADFTVVLDSEPTDTVIIALASDNTDEGTVTASVTFTAANWNTPQTVTVTGVDDTPPVSDGTQAYSVITTIDGGTLAAEYAGLVDAEIADIAMQNQDNDSANINVSVTDADTSEDGDSGTLVFTTSTQPVSDVIIPLSIVAGELLEGSFSNSSVLGTSSVTLNASNWDTGVTVTLYGVDDAIATLDGTQSFTVVTGDVAAGSDPAFITTPALGIADAVFNNADNDTITVEFVAATSDAVEGESSGLPLVRVSGAQLNSDQAATIAITGGTAIAGVDYNPATGPLTLVIPSADYNTAVDFSLPDLVVISDNVDEFDETIEFELTGVSSDLTLGTTLAHSHGITDNDTAEVLITQATPGITTEAGGTTSFSIALGSEPTADVIINFTSDNTAEGTVQASTTFTPTNWDQPQTITVTGVDDTVTDGLVAYSVQSTVDASTTATEYLVPLSIDAVALQNQGDEVAHIVVSAIDPTSGEDGTTATVQFSLNAQPANGADVTIPLSLDTSTEAFLSANQITISNANWNQPGANEITITGLDDESVDGDQGYTLVTGDPTSTNVTYDVLLAEDVADPQLINTDNDVLSVSFSSDNTDAAEEAGSVAPTIRIAGGIAPEDFTVELVITQASGATPASGDSDYTAPTVQSVTIPAGDYRTAVDVSIPPITIIDDAAVEGDELFALHLQSPGDGVSLQGAAARTDTTVNIVDNDTASVVITDAVQSVEEGSTDTFMVVLGSQPLNPVTVNISNSDSDVATLDATTLVFTSDNWHLPRTVTITGVPDADFIEESVTIELTVDESSDSFFTGLDAQSFTEQVLEPEANNDADADGLLNIEECPTAPCQDSDNDGTPDYLDEDDDNDGLLTRIERESGISDYLDPDTDGDLVIDGVEATDGTAYGPAGDMQAGLTYVDSDNDLVPDYIENIDGTDPLDPNDYVDNDQGGLPDYIELTWFNQAGIPPTDYTIAGDDCRDIDGDGLPDPLEISLKSGINDVDSPTVNGNGDEDLDTISNAIEVYLAGFAFTDVTTTGDLDRDGMPDAFEVQNCLNPLAAQDSDRDQDGVPDVLEVIAGMDIDNTTDTDNDGIPDAREIALGSDWIDSSDPLANGAQDSDGDGITDALEDLLLTFYGIADASPTMDTDGDGVTDVEEIRQFSDPGAVFQPVVWIEASQQGVGVNVIGSMLGTVTAHALVGNHQSGMHEFDWSATSPEVLATATITNARTLEFDPSVLTDTVVLHVRVRNTLAGLTSPWSPVSYPIAVSTSETLTQLSDVDNDGIMDAADAANGLLGLADKVAVSGDTTASQLINTVRGEKMQLGSTARVARLPSVLVEPIDVSQVGNGRGLPALAAISDTLEFPNRLFDFEVANLPSVGAIGTIVIPLQFAIPADASYQKYTPDVGYSDFDTSEGDSVKSAPVVQGECPAPGSSLYLDGLAEGDVCIQLTIRDAGPNDADGEINGLVKDPGGIAVARTEPPLQAASDGKIYAGLQGGGCSVLTGDSSARDPMLLLMVFGAFALLMRSVLRRRSELLRGTRRSAFTYSALLCALAGIPAGSAHAEEGVDALNLERHIYAGAGFGRSWTEPDTTEVSGVDPNDRVHPGLQLTLGMDLNTRFSLEGHAADLGDAGISPSGSINYRELGASALAYFGPARYRYKRRGFGGFARVGLGYLWTTGSAGLVYEKKNAMHLTLGVGLEFAMSGGLAVRGETVTYDADVNYTQLSVVYRFGRNPAPAPIIVAQTPVEPKPEPAAALPVEPPDDDKDKVININDYCPNTLPFRAVDVRGCALFSGNIDGVGFESGSAVLKSAAKINLDNALVTLNKYDYLPFRVEAHTDDVGSAADNMILSRSRAASAVSYLVAAGVNPDRIDEVAFGESRPVASNDTPEGRSENRRVEIYLYRQEALEE